jgi:hypothetical protein
MSQDASRARALARAAPVSLFVSHKAAAFVFLEAVCFCLMKLIRIPADQNTTPISNCKMRPEKILLVYLKI